MLLLTLILISIFTLFGISIVLYKSEELFISVGGGLLMVLGFYLLILFSFSAHGWMAAKYKAEILNRKYEITLTQSQVYFAGDTIEKEIINLTIPDYLCEVPK